MGDERDFAYKEKYIPVDNRPSAPTYDVHGFSDGDGFNHDMDLAYRAIGKTFKWVCIGVCVAGLAGLIYSACFSDSSKKSSSGVNYPTIQRNVPSLDH